MNENRFASLIFLMVGIYALILSLRLPIGNLREPGPGMLPLSISILLCISGIIGWFIRTKEKKSQRLTFPLMTRGLITPLKIVGITTSFILVVERLGYLLTSSLYIFLLFFWISRYRLWISIFLSIIIGIGSGYFFGKILSVPLPKGLIYF